MSQDTKDFELFWVRRMFFIEKVLLISQLHELDPREGKNRLAAMLQLAVLSPVPTDYRVALELARATARKLDERHKQLLLDVEACRLCRIVLEVVGEAARVEEDSNPVLPVVGVVRADVLLQQLLRSRKLTNNVVGDGAHVGSQITADSARLLRLEFGCGRVERQDLCVQKDACIASAGSEMDDTCWTISRGCFPFSLNML